MVAVKALKTGSDSQLCSGWRREIDILRTLDHLHIVQYKGCCQDPGGCGLRRAGLVGRDFGGWSQQGLANENQPQTGGRDLELRLGGA